ncbi:MAG: peptide chain release factor N(5)-glutamine methyltransferase [Lunatimonas sp.]|uniref:peptide chain release factor N(5)-glutamine methyltransferase n=1 Tax=Lunatimonas sp. TaxID=2060141 RepID=UPI00263B41A9|nr:peptide chain release factor N(5)-glutamine methyltransferase [Lunatimonas sp.]MCC5937696.1 peptide chain release factor N(5)-glutamine methyltransferase [Lunatimonas sp.]
MAIPVRQLFLTDRERLSPTYSKEESENLVLWLMEHYLGVAKKDLLLNKVLSEIPVTYHAAMDQLIAGRPIQYILGEAPFYGRNFLVNEAVLIPRRETEELVYGVIQGHRAPDLRVLDIGTGSGCIPVTLALDLPNAELYAVDISEDALDVARRNAQLHGVKVVFQRLNILKEALPWKDLDIILSNPPYVTEREKDQMSGHVLQHEPHLALFVPDQDPLRFYREIAEKAWKALKPGGMLFVEINEAFGSETVNLMRESGFTHVSLKMDMQGKDRMVQAQKGL